MAFSLNHLFSMFFNPCCYFNNYCCYQKVIRLLSRSPQAKLRKTNLSKQAFLDLFGKDNVISVDTVMTRVIIEVKDVELVQLEELKKLNVGILITGNVIKCSSEEYSNLFGK